MYKLRLVNGSRNKYIMYSSSVMLNYSKVVGKVFFRRICVFMLCLFLLVKVL